MRRITSELLFAFALFWYAVSAMAGAIVLGEAWNSQEGLRILLSMNPVGWIVIPAFIALGPLAHWLSRRRNE